MSPRTLRRRLQAAGTSFRQLLQEYQLQIAMRELESGQRPLPLVAQRCGFADAAGFREAFKRWTGMTPREYRVQFRRKL